MKVFMRDGDRDIHLLSMDTIPRVGEVIQVKGAFPGDTGWTGWEVIAVRYFTSASVELMTYPYAVLYVKPGMNEASAKPINSENHD